MHDQIAFPFTYAFAVKRVTKIGSSCCIQHSMFCVPLSDSTFCFAQVPCKDIIEHARSSASTAPGIRELAEVSLGHSEEGVHKVLSDCGCSLPVPLQYADLPSQKDVPYINMTDWVKFLGETGRLKYIVGTNDRLERREICYHFWSRLERIRPHHPIFKMARENLLDLRDTEPLLHHGDEGRTYKRAAIMIISTHGLLGSGSRKAEDGNKRDYSPENDPMRLNFLGSTLTTHYIFTALPQAIYKDSPKSLDVMLELYAQDMRRLTNEGIKMKIAGRDEHLHFVCVAAKGDLPYLAKAGHMSRTFSMCARQSTSKSFAKGICWQCLGGVEGRAESYDWEDFSLQARWLRTRGLEPAIGQQCALLTIPQDSADQFFRADIWHVFHLGCGKTFAASSIVVLLERQEGSVDLKLRLMGDDYKAFCKRTRQYGYISGFSRDFLSWETAADCPVGRWYKGHLTTRLMAWLQDYLSRNFANDTDPFVVLLASGLSDKFSVLVISI